MIPNIFKDDYCFLDFDKCLKRDNKTSDENVSFERWLGIESKKDIEGLMG